MRGSCAGDRQGSQSRRKNWFWLAQCVAESPHRAATGPKPKPQPVADWDAWEACDIAAELLKAGDGLISAWEHDFLNNMANWDGPATDRQDAVLHRIANKLGWKP